MGTNRFSLIMGVLVVLAVVCAGTARAQDAQTTHPAAPEWVVSMGEQLATGIASPIEDVKVQSLQHMAYFAYFYGEQMNLKPALPNLLDIFQDDPSEENRLLALAAIRAIGDDDTMAEVRRTLETAPPESPRLQLVTMAALMDFYGGETFTGDEESADLAQRLFDFYSNPKIFVGPPVIIDVKTPPRK